MHKLLGVLMYSYSIESSVDRLKRTRSRHNYYNVIVPSVFIGVCVVILLFFIGYDVNPLISIGGLLGLYFLYLATSYFLDKGWQIVFDTRLNCPSCRKHIPAFEPWMCPNCDEIRDVPAEVAKIEERNRALPKGAFERSFLAYSFIYKCSTCTNIATTYKCHSCGEVLALTDDPDPERFAYNPVRLPGGIFVEEDLKSQVEKIERKDRSKHPEIRDAERKFDVKDAFLDLEKKREEHYKRKVDDGLMSEEEAQKHLGQDKLYIKRRRTLG